MSKDRIVIIDCIKAFCIILVILNHSGLFDRTNNIFFLLVIDTAVPIFMVLSGYTFALKYRDRSLGEMFDKKDILKRFLRYTIPMLIAFTIYEMYQVLKGEFLIISAIKTFILGRYGQGAYYYALMIEFMIIAPEMLWLVRLKKFNGVIISAVLNMVYQFICNVVDMNETLYRSLVFRYMTMIALGMYAYFAIEDRVSLFKDKSCRALIALGICLGIIYKLLPRFGYSYLFFKQSPWGRTSMITALYIFPIVYYVLSIVRSSEFMTSGTRWGIVATIGKASYHIMYTQMIYYDIRPCFDLYVFDIKTLGVIPELLVNLWITIFLGVMFG